MVGELIFITFICFWGMCLYNTASIAISKYWFKLEELFLLAFVVLNFQKKFYHLCGHIHNGSHVRPSGVKDQSLFGTYSGSGMIKHNLTFEIFNTVSTCLHVTQPLCKITVSVICISIMYNMGTILIWGCWTNQ